jgi:hypothetical protein
VKISLEVSGELLSGLDGFIDQRDKPPNGWLSREAALVTIVEDWLMGKGFISLPGDEDRTITALEAAQVPKG